MEKQATQRLLTAGYLAGYMHKEAADKDKKTSLGDQLFRDKDNVTKLNREPISVADKKEFPWMENQEEADWWKAEKKKKPHLDVVYPPSYLSIADKSTEGPAPDLARGDIHEEESTPLEDLYDVQERNWQKDMFGKELSSRYPNLKGKSLGTVAYNNPNYAEEQARRLSSVPKAAHGVLAQQSRPEQLSEFLKTPALGGKQVRETLGTGRAEEMIDFYNDLRQTMTPSQVMNYINELGKQHGKSKVADEFRDVIQKAIKTGAITAQNKQAPAGPAA